MGSPDSRARCFRAYLRSTTAQGTDTSRVIDAHRVAFRHVHGVGTLESRTISQLNIWPAHTPVTASPEPSRAPAHDSGPM